MNLVIKHGWWFFLAAALAYGRHPDRSQTGVTSPAFHLVEDTDQVHSS